jgi:hypothetical protein
MYKGWSSQPTFEPLYAIYRFQLLPPFNNLLGPFTTKLTDNQTYKVQGVCKYLFYLTRAEDLTGDLEEFSFRQLQVMGLSTGLNALVARCLG